jgi:hypothetical protein
MVTERYLSWPPDDGETDTFNRRQANEQRIRRKSLKVAAFAGAIYETVYSAG